MFRSKPKPAKSPRRSSLRMETLEGRELMAAGVFDTSFGFRGRATIDSNLPSVATPTGSTAIERLSNGQVLVGSTVQFGNGDRDFSVTRLNANGTLDRSFGTESGSIRVSFDRGGQLQDELADIDVDSRGRIILVGSVEFAGNDYDFGVARLLANGQIDTTFGANGRTTVHFDRGGDRADRPSAVEIDSSDRIVVAGSVQITATTRDVGVIRLNTNGGLDGSFGSGGRSIAPINRNGLCDDFAGGMELDSQGRIVIAASAQYRPGSNDYDFAALRINPNGFYDRSFSGDGIAIAAFDRGGVLKDIARDVAIGPNDTVVLAGSVSSPSQGTDFGVARFTTTGGLDFNFDGDGKLVIVPADRYSHGRNYVTAVSIDSRNRIVMLGAVESGPTFLTAVMRVSTNGFRDPSFGANGLTIASLNQGGGGSDTPGGMALDPSNNILISGVGSPNKAVAARILGS